MVDFTDKVKDKLGGSDDSDKEKKDSGSGSKKKSKKKKSGDAVKRSVEKKKQSSSESKDLSKSTTDEDIERLLMCIGNIIAYTEGAKLRLDDKKGKKATQRHHATKNIYDESVTFMGAFNIQEVAERHGYDWQEDILEYILQHQDFDDMVKKYN